MNFRRLTLAAAIAAALLTAGGVSAAGLFPGFPNASGTLTGNETIPADTNLTNGQYPQTELVTPAQIATYARSLGVGTSFRNFLIGGDFGTNPWQRGTTFNVLGTTASYTADRWFVVSGASSSVQVTKQTGASDITTGFAASARLQRNSANADLTRIQFGQVLESQNSTGLQGQTVAISFSALGGTNLSAASSNISVVIATGTGSDQSATLFGAGTWTGFSAAASTTVSVSTTWTRYTVTAVIPTTATQVGVSLGFIPTGTAGAADWVEIAGVQLEAIGTGTTTAGAFERRPAEIEVALAQRYFVQISEAASMTTMGLGQATSTTVAKIVFPLPTQLRSSSPTITQSSGSVGLTAAVGSAGTANIASGTATANTVMLSVTSGQASLVAGAATQLVGGGGSGFIGISAEL